MLKLHESKKKGLEISQVCNVSDAGYSMPVVVRAYYVHTEIEIPFLVQNENFFCHAKDKGRAKHFHELQKAHELIETLERKFCGDWWFEIVSMSTI